MGEGSGRGGVREGEGEGGVGEGWAEGEGGREGRGGWNATRSGSEISDVLRTARKEVNVEVAPDCLELNRFERFTER